MVKESTKEFVCAFHKCLKNISESLETNNFNKSVAYVREAINLFYDNLDRIESIADCFSYGMTKMTIILSIFMPYFAEELWEKLGGPGLACEQSWPEFIPEYVSADTMTIPVQINGKLRSTLSVSADASEDEIFAQVLADEKVIKFLEGRDVRKKVYVKNKIINLVV